MSLALRVLLCAAAGPLAASVPQLVKQGTAPPATVGDFGLPEVIGTYRAHNVGIDDPQCSETVFGDGEVGMLIPDSFFDCSTPNCSWYSLQPGARYYEYDDGTALFVGEAFNVHHPSLGFVVRIGFDGRLDPKDAAYPCEGTPYIAYGPLSPTACEGWPEPEECDCGDSVDPGLWHCFDGMVGTLEGIGGYEGAFGVLTTHSAAFQVGKAANDKNLHFGAAGWFKATYLQQPTTGERLPTEPDLFTELFVDLTTH